MRRRHLPSHLRRSDFLPIVLTAAAMLLISVATHDALAQSANANVNAGANSNGKKQDPTKTFKVPPLPNGSAQIKPKAGMSDKEWGNAYKETGRPLFDRNTVKKVGDTVERD
ncbi:hypothetical protein AAHK20_11150 [Trinickia sp. YCB016]